MTMPEITTKEVLLTENCCACHILFAVPASFQRLRRNDHNAFYCPSGHGQSYKGPSNEERLQEQLDAVRLREIEERQRRVDAENDNARMKSRIANGVCTQCNRSFANLKRHMDCKHKPRARKAESEVQP